MEIEVGSQGPRDAKVMIIGEAPDQYEVENGRPFVGPFGLELSRMLQEAGFDRSKCYVTNVCRVRPPGNDIKKFFGTKASKNPTILGRYPGTQIVRGLQLLEQDIRDIDPDLILAFGDTSNWAVTGEGGITKWRGSVLECRDLGQGADHQRPKVIPTYHPSAVLRNWSLRNIVVHDLRRARRELDTNGRAIKIPDYKLRIQPNYQQVMDTLSTLRSGLRDTPWLACDIETQRRKIDCIGLAWSKLDAICIPIIQMDVPAERRFYWTVEEQTEIILALRDLLTDPLCKVIGQNFPYDQQYIAREWGFIPNLAWDTMTMHHSIFCTTQKSLDFQSSMYCDFHRYWKEDAKDAGGHRLSDHDQWIYNARDCVVTYECFEKQQVLINQMKFPSKGGLTPQERQMKIHPAILNGMLRGVKVSQTKREEILLEVTKAIEDRESFLNHVCSHPLNPRSPKQLQSFFYTDMGMRPINNRKTKKPTTDEAALEKLSKRDPLVAPICEFINDVRSLGTFRAVCSVPLDHDGRLRCSYSIPGTDTYRFNSTSDAFGFGTNLQNITAGTNGSPEEIAELRARGVLLKPNLRKLFVPDPGFTIAEYDLPQADAQVVAWEAQDDHLKAIFRDPRRDLHSENAVTIFGKDAWLPGCEGSLPGKKTVRPEARQYAKVGVHAANYDVKAVTLAAALGTSVAQAESFINTWFRAHPNIRDWQNTIRAQMVTRRYIENAFGYRRYCFDRPDTEFKEALAWIPQSTVALVTNTGIMNVENELLTQFVFFLLQVHDSAAFQFPLANGPRLAKEIQRCMTVAVPYDDPLEMIPDAKFSEVSWGEGERRDWLKEAA